MDVSEGLLAIFNHYGTTFKSNLSHITENSSEVPKTIDRTAFLKLCREAPDLARVISRNEVDLIFAKCKMVRMRVLTYENFLDALLELSLKILPHEEPTKAVAQFLSKYIFALFDQPPCPTSLNIVEVIHRELLEI